MATEERVTNPSTRKQWVWIMLMVNIVFVLVLMTLGIFALRIGNTLPEGTDILFIVAKNPSAEVEDESGIVWEKHTNVDIFKTSYKNGNGEFTVVSNNGDKVFAPGTATSYKFTAQNSGNMAVDYTIDLNFSDMSLSLVSFLSSGYLLYNSFIICSILRYISLQR